jgi:hypothetical protein
MKVSEDLVRLDREADRVAADPLYTEIRQGDELSDLIVTGDPDYTASIPAKAGNDAQGYRNRHTPAWSCPTTSGPLV